MSQNSSKILKNPPKIKFSISLRVSRRSIRSVPCLTVEKEEELKELIIPTYQITLLVHARCHKRKDIITFTEPSILHYFNSDPHLWHDVRA